VRSRFSMGTFAIDNSNGLSVGLRTVRHKTFEIGLLQTVFSHEFVEFSIHNTLDLCVLELHVTHGNGHDLVICCIEWVTGHCGPLLDMLDMVKHEPYILQISSWLHAFDEVHTASRSVYQHLEYKDLILASPWKDLAMEMWYTFL
jgi:hypothetical protein